MVGGIGSGVDVDRGGAVAATGAELSIGVVKLSAGAAVPPAALSACCAGSAILTAWIDFVQEIGQFRYAFTALHPLPLLMFYRS